MRSCFADCDSPVPVKIARLDNRRGRRGRVKENAQALVRLEKPVKSMRVWCGPVASEKTTKALHYAKRLVRHSMDLVLVRPRISRRSHETDDGFLVTKGGARWPCFDITDPYEIVELGREADVLWVDEPALIENHKEEVSAEDVFHAIQEVRGRARILVSGCAATSEMQMFGSCMAMLLAVADSVIWCLADCDECGRMNCASRSWHIGGPKSQTVKVGGEDIYEALCPTCWTKRMKRVLKYARV